MQSDEMILTHINIDRVSQFIQAESYTVDDSCVIFHNVPCTSFNHAKTRGVKGGVINGCFETVMINIGTFVFK